MQSTTVSASTPSPIKQTVDASLRQELAAYKAAPFMQFNPQKMHESDPLMWWRDRWRMYPTLWKLARRFLAIPATSAPSERAFSTAGNLVSLRRASLKVDRVSDLLLLKENLDLARSVMQQAGAARLKDG